jgi:prevent-host-death family protein
MARTVRRSGMKEVPLSEVKDDLSRFLREAETQEIVITRHGKPAGVLIGFESEEKTGSSTGSNMTRVSCVASNRRGTACARDAGPDSKTLKPNKWHVHTSRRSARAKKGELSDSIAWTRARHHSPSSSAVARHPRISRNRRRSPRKTSYQDADSRTGNLLPAKRVFVLGSV